MKRRVRGNVMSPVARKGAETTVEHTPAIKRLIRTGVLEDLGKTDRHDDGPAESTVGTDRVVAEDHVIDNGDE